MATNNSYELSRAATYCFKRGSKAVFLDRKDRDIKEFDTYQEAIEFALKNIHLIDRKNGMRRKVQKK